MIRRQHHQLHDPHFELTLHLLRLQALKFKTQLLEGGFEERQAQALVDALTQASTEHLATKTDIQELRTEIESVRGEIIQSRAEGRTEIEKFRGDTQTSMENLRGQMSNIKCSTVVFCFLPSNSIASGRIYQPLCPQGGGRAMVLPIVTPAPVVVSHGDAFRDLFDNQCEFRHFQNYLTGLMVLENKSMANISNCIINSADKTNLSRFFSDAPWLEKKINDRRLEYMLEQTAPQRRAANASGLILDDTLCEHVGSLFEYVDRHYDHCDNRYPLAHNVVTSFYLSGAVRFPVEARLYRRYEEITQWEAFVQQHFPEREIPKEKKARQRFHKEVDETLLDDMAFEVLHQQFKTKITLAQELINSAIDRGLPFQTVLMDSWYLSEDIVKTLADEKKDWVSLLKKNRNVECHSFRLRDADGEVIQFSKPHIKIEDLVPLIPKSSYKKVMISDKEYWCFSLKVRIPSLGKVRIVISYDNPNLEGTYAVLISNRTDWSAKRMIRAYLQRWPIETFYQDSKGHLGLDAYRMRTSEAIKKHWCLVFVAYSLLHLECLPASPVRGKSTKVGHPIKTIGEACRQQGEAVIEALILYAHDLLQRGESAAEVFAMLFAKQRKGMAA